MGMRSMLGRLCAASQLVVLVAIKLVRGAYPPKAAICLALWSVTDGLLVGNAIGVIIAAVDERTRLRIEFGVLLVGYLVGLGWILLTVIDWIAG